MSDREDFEDQPATRREKLKEKLGRIKDLKKLVTDDPLIIWRNDLDNAEIWKIAPSRLSEMCDDVKIIWTQWTHGKTAHLSVAL